NAIVRSVRNAPGLICQVCPRSIPQDLPTPTHHPILKWSFLTVLTEWLTANEAAQYLKVKPRPTLKWAKQGSIPAHPLSGLKRVTYRFLRAELDAMLALPSAAGDGGLNAAQQS